MHDLPADANSTSLTFCPSEARPYVLAAAILASALGFIDGSVVSIAMPAMRADLSASLAQAQWISNAYALALSALILIGGAAGDRFGLRLTFVLGISLFVAASIACALAPDANWLIGFRAAQGVGAAIMVPCSLAIIAKSYPKTERGRAIGTWAAASALTTALGPVVGGFVLSAFDDSVWRVIFAINLPLGGVAIWLLLAKVPVDPAGAHRRLDIFGALLAATGFGALAFGLTGSGDQSLSAQGYWVISALLLGVAGVVAFVIWEARHSEPMVSLSLFRVRAFSGANASTFFLYFSLSAILFYLPMLLIAGWGRSAAEAGFLFLPLSAAIALLSGPVGRLSDMAGPRLPITVGSVLVGAAFGGLSAVVGFGFHAFWSAVFPLMILMGLGMALVVSPLSTAVMVSVEEKDTGAASGINNAVSRIAGLVAVAAMGALAGIVYSRWMSPTSGANVVTVEFGEPALGLPAAAEAARVGASDAAFAAVAAVATLFCLLSAVTSWFTLGDHNARRDG